MDVGRSFDYVFEDKEWPKKLLIGGLFYVPSVIIALVMVILVISDLPITGLLVLYVVLNLILCPVPVGYSLRTLRNSARGAAPDLPAWDRIGADWVSGLKQWLALLILLVPAIPGIISTSVAGNWMDRGDASPLLVCCFGPICLSSLWMLFVAIIYPMARAHYALTDEFASFFRFRKIVRAIGRQLGDYVVALLLIIVVQAIAGTLGSLVCLVGIAFLGFYGQLVTADLLGQVVASDVGQEPTKTTPPAPRPAPPADTLIAAADAALQAEVESEGSAAPPVPPEDEDYGGPEA